MPRNNQGSGQGNGGGGSISIQDFTFIGPRSKATISFRISRGNRPVPDMPAVFYLGLNNLKFKARLLKGGPGADADEPWTILANPQGIGYKDGINLSPFKYEDYNKITIMVDGAQPQTIDMDSVETIPSKPVISKPKGFDVTPDDDPYKSFSDWFVFNLQTRRDGAPAEKEIELRSDVLMSVKQRGISGFLCEKQDVCTILTDAKGRARIEVKIEDAAASLVFTDTETLEETKRNLQCEA